MPMPFASILFCGVFVFVVVVVVAVFLMAFFLWLPFLGAFFMALFFGFIRVWSLGFSFLGFLYSKGLEFRVAPFLGGVPLLSGFRV